MSLPSPKHPHILVPIIFYMTSDLIHLKTIRHDLKSIYRSTHPLDFKILRTATSEYCKLTCLQLHFIIQILFSLLFPILVSYGRPLTCFFTAILYAPFLPPNPSPHFLNCLLHTSQTKFQISTSTCSPPFSPLLFIFDQQLSLQIFPPLHLPL